MNSTLVPANREGPCRLPARHGGLAFKWVPKGWLSGMPAGELNFGVNLNVSLDHLSGAGRHHLETGLLALATLKPGDAAAVNANRGAEHEHTSRTAATLLNLAIVWTPASRPGCSPKPRRTARVPYSLAR